MHLDSTTNIFSASILPVIQNRTAERKKKQKEALLMSHSNRGATTAVSHSAILKHAVFGQFRPRHQPSLSSPCWTRPARRKKKELGPLVHSKNKNHPLMKISLAASGGPEIEVRVNSLGCFLLFRGHSLVSDFSLAREILLLVGRPFFSCTAAWLFSS